MKFITSNVQLYYQIEKKKKTTDLYEQEQLQEQLLNKLQLNQTIVEEQQTNTRKLITKLILCHFSLPPFYWSLETVVLNYDILALPVYQRNCWSMNLVQGKTLVWILTFALGFLKIVFVCFQRCFRSHVLHSFCTIASSHSI